MNLFILHSTMVHNQDFQDPSSIVGVVDTQKVFKRQTSLDYTPKTSTE